MQVWRQLFEFWRAIHMSMQLGIHVVRHLCGVGQRSVLFPAYHEWILLVGGLIQLRREHINIEHINIVLQLIIIEKVRWLDLLLQQPVLEWVLQGALLRFKLVRIGVCDLRLQWGVQLLLVGLLPFKPEMLGR